MASAVGFVATVLITQLLGAGVFGTYALIVAIVIWMKTIAIMGIRSAVMKRVSETGDTGEFIIAGAILLGGILTILSSILYLGSEYINATVGQQITVTIIALTWASAVFAFGTGLLEGQHLVHLAAMLRPLNTGIRSILQIVAVLLGFGLTGIVFGHGIAALLSGIVGLVIIADFTPKRPSQRHFRELFEFAQFSWLGKLSGQTFTSMDTVILGIFVSVSFIGIYEAAWNLASLFAVFGAAIGQTLFPEISKISSQERMSEVYSLLEDGLTFAGLLLIPGLIGSFVIGDLVLLIYGNEFPQGHYILVLLILSRLIYAYADQLLTVLNAIDRPDLAFRANGAFIVTNLGLNILLVWQYGWFGAAIATVVSACIALSMSFWYTDSVLGDAPFPMLEFGRQLFAAVLMGTAVYGARIYLQDGIAAGIGLVVLGGIVYFAVLLSISTEFRTTVVNNIPQL